MNKVLSRSCSLLSRSGRVPTPLPILWTQRRGYAEGASIDVQPGYVNAPGTERVEVFVSAEQNKIDVIVQKDLDIGGTVTVPPAKWDEKYASTSESIIKAEQSKESSFADLQVESVKQIQKIEVQTKTTKQ